MDRSVVLSGCQVLTLQGHNSCACSYELTENNRSFETLNAKISLEGTKNNPPVSEDRHLAFSL